MKNLLIRLTSLLFFALLAFPLSAQTSYGTISGAVVDVSGAAVAGSQVTVLSLQTGESREIVATGNGSFRAEALLPGPYSVIASASGFATWKTTVQVSASVTTSVNPTLKVGAAETTVNVAADQQLLQTESGEVSATVGSLEISSLPVSSLNSYALALTLPNTVSITTVGPGNGTKFSVDGQRTRSNNFLIEGQDNNDAGITGQGLQPENTEAEESVTYLINASAPEFGRGGMVANLVYKSGSNQWHGAVWERLLNSSLEANDHNNVLNGAPKSKYRENIYGFRIGGPAIHDKVFFFVSDQWDKYRTTANPGILTLPTAAGYTVLNQYKSNTQIANLITAYSGLTASSDTTKYPTYRSSLALGLDPTTGLDRGTVDVGGYQRSIAQKSDGQELVAKGTYIIGDKDRLEVRLVRSPYSSPYDVYNFPNQLPGFDTMQSGTAYNAGLTENHTFSPTLLNELRLSYGRIGFLFLPRSEDYTNPLFGPTLSISGITGYGIPTSTPQGRFHNTYQLQDGLSWTKGTHSLKFGFDVAQIRVSDQVPFIFYGSYAYAGNNTGTTYTALGNYMDGYSGYSSSTSPSMTKYFGNNVAHPNLVNQAYYAQDHWKATSKLALDFGLRYEYFGAPFNYLKYPALADDLTCFPCGQQQKPRYTNFAPRFGFAYSLTDKMVIRGGIGIFHDPQFTNMVDNMQASSPNAATPVKYANISSSTRGLANWSSYISTLNSTPLATNSVTSMKADTKSPATYEWNLALEREIPGSMTVTAKYTGTRGLHLLGLEMVNPKSNNTGTFVYPTRGSIAAFVTNGDSEYHAASLQVERKPYHGLMTRFAFTYAKALDDVSDGYTSGNYSAYAQNEPYFGYGRGLEWGPSAYDHRFREVLSLVYAPPVWHPSAVGAKVAASIVNNWQFTTITSFQSGSVYDVHVGIDMNYDYVSNDRPVLANKNKPINTFAVANADFWGTGGGYCDGSYYINYVKSANRTCHPVTLDDVHWYVGDYAEYTNKTISRNASYTPGIFNSDATIQRSFTYHDRHSLSVRAEVFNWLNHGNTGIPSFTLSSLSGTSSSYPYPNDPWYAANGYVSSFANYQSTVTGSRAIRVYVNYSF